MRLPSRFRRVGKWSANTYHYVFQCVCQYIFQYAPILNIGAENSTRNCREFCISWYSPNWGEADENRHRECYERARRPSRMTFIPQLSRSSSADTPSARASTGARLTRMKRRRCGGRRASASARADDPRLPLRNRIEAANCRAAKRFGSGARAQPRRSGVHQARHVAGRMPVLPHELVGFADLVEGAGRGKTGVYLLLPHEAVDRRRLLVV